MGCTQHLHLTAGTALSKSILLKCIVSNGYNKEFYGMSRLELLEDTIKSKMTWVESIAANTKIYSTDKV